VFASLTGIAGSSQVGDRARFGGKAGMAGHIRAGDDVTVAAQTVVTRDVGDGETIMGFPGRPRGEFLKAQALLRRLPRIERRLRELEARGREEE
jgi:UDP-3-O-[3-hydroxymyristoyl] glucosamine N-acyltransferase